MTPIDGVWPREMTGQNPTGFRALITAFEAPPGARPGIAILERIQLEVWWMSGEKRKTFQLEGFRRGLMTAAEAGLHCFRKHPESGFVFGRYHKVVADQLCNVVHGVGHHATSTNSSRGAGCAYCGSACIEIETNTRDDHGRYA